MHPPLNDIDTCDGHWGHHSDGTVTGGPGQPPARWIDAIRRVRRDVPLMQTGDAANAWNDGDNVWNLFFFDTGSVTVEVRDGEGRLHVYTENAVHDEWLSDASSVAVWVADLVQGDLAASQWVLWPAEPGAAPFDPVVMDGEAVWVRRRTHNVVAPIGGLSSIARRASDQSG